jgi:hypothetical protein
VIFSTAPAALIDIRSIKAARQAVGALRKSNPNASRSRLAGILIRKYCVKAGAVGGATTAVGMIPALGKLGQWALGLVGDTAATAQLQAALILQIFAIYEREPDANEEKRILTWIATVGAGGGEVVEQLGSSVAHKLVQTFGGRLLARGLPTLEVSLSTASHVASTYLVGQRAWLYCQFDGDEAAVAQYEDEHRSLDPRRFTRWAKQALGKTLQTAEGAGLSVLAAIRRVLKR